jgi:uncharacterized protein
VPDAPLQQLRRRFDARLSRAGDVKFHLDAATGNVVTGCGPGWVRVGGDEYRENIVLTPQRVAPGFAPGGFDALQAQDFAALLANSPEIVLLGTGSTQRFLRPSVTAPLHDANVGLEVMDTRAACRTYNILVAEGRAVTAALIVEQALGSAR